MNNNIIGYDAQTGQPIYANQNNNTISTDNKNLNNSKNGSKLNIILYIMIRNLILCFQQQQCSFNFLPFYIVKGLHQFGKAILISIYPFHCKYNKSYIII